MWNGTDVPCLFDQKVAYSKLLYALPLDLEYKIVNGVVANEDLVFRRYKTLIIPTESLLHGDALIELIDYFMRYSTIKKIENKS